MRIMLALPLILSLALLGACNDTQTAGSRPKVGVADVSRLMRDSVPGKEGIKFLESVEEEVKTTLQDLNARLEKNPEDEAALQELQAVYTSAQQRIQIQGQNVAGALYDVLQQVLDKFRAEHGYDFILGQDTVVSFNPAIDVTNAVMEELNKQKIDFKPVAVPAPALPVQPAQTPPAAPEGEAAAPVQEEAQSAPVSATPPQVTEPAATASPEAAQEQAPETNPAPALPDESEKQPGH